MKHKYNLISIQPSTIYFLWQLEIQFINLLDLNFPLSNYYVVFPDNGERVEELKAFMKKWSEANFLFFKDERGDKSYIPSIRPHLLAKFYDAIKPTKPLLLIEADIIFLNSLPNFSDEELYNNKIYYGDTDSYLGRRYLEEKGGGELFSIMCKISGVNEIKAKEDIKVAGGAQYLIKPCINSGIWRRIEASSNNLYKYLTHTCDEYSKKTKTTPIQTWCADMWVFMWVLNERSSGIEIHKELNFVFPTDKKNLVEIKGIKILHNAGVTEATKDKFFYKGEFIKGIKNKDFSYVNSEYCSHFYLKYVERLLLWN
jgi:hypothetical protein